MRVLGFGTYDRARHPRAGIVLDGLRERGDDVHELNEPLGFSTAERVEMLGRPWLAYRLLLRLLRCWFRLAVRSRRAAKPDVVLVGYLGHFDVVLARLLYPRTRIVLDLMIFAADTARDRGTSASVKLRLLDGLDRLAVRCADLVMLDTDEHAELLRPAQRHKAVVVPVGASAEWFAAGDDAADRPADGPLRAVFYGLYTPLQGAPVIGAALGLLAGDRRVQVTMIGTGQDLAATREAAAANPDATWLDWVAADELPALVAAHDVCLGIFATSPKGRRVVPNKVYQGAAAGCAIVTSDTAPQRRLIGSDALLVPPGDPAALAAALRALADDREACRRWRVAARAAARDRFTPSGIVEPLRRRLSDPAVSGED